MPILPVLARLLRRWRLAMPAAGRRSTAPIPISTSINALVLDADDFGASWACPGYKGYPLMVAEGDLRFSSAYGFNVAKESAGRQTLPPFNYARPKLEWRLSNASGGWLPVATIVRYFTADPETGEDEGAGAGGDPVLRRAAPAISPMSMPWPITTPMSWRAQAADKAGDFDCANDEMRDDRGIRGLVG